MGREDGFYLKFQYYDVLKSALKAHDVLPAGYLQNMPRQAEGHSDMWLTAYWEYFRSGTSEQKLDFIRLVGGFETDTAKKILLEALSDKGDWRILQSAALPLGRMKYTPAASPLKALSDHPVAAVQISALSALDGLKTGSLKGRSKYWQKTLSQKVTYCSAEPKNFKDDAKGQKPAISSDLMQAQMGAIYAIMIMPPAKVLA